MKQRKFIHRLVDMVERELEATLAILVVLAGIVGYTLASTEATSSEVLTTQEAGSTLMIGSGSYSTLSFDRTYTSGPTYQLRRLNLEPSDAASIAGKGLTGSSAGQQYTATITLSGMFTGKLYVHGTYSSVSLNGTAVTSPTASVTLIDAESIILGFEGGTNAIRAISINAGTIAKNDPKEVANFSLVPSTSTTVAGTARTFIVVATDTNGASIPSNQLDIKWSIETTPNNIATINANGVVTPTAAGTIVVTAKVDGKTASSTITVVDAPKSTPNEAWVPPVSPSYPGAPEGDEKTEPTSTDKQKDAQEIAKKANEQSLLDQVASLLVPPADAATESVATPAKVVTQVLFSDSAIVQRKSTAPTQSELNTVTANMTLTQKVVARFSVAAEQIKKDIKAMIFGVKITDTEGKVVVEKPNALGLIVNQIRNMTGGANAGTMKVTPDEDLPL